MKVKLPFSDGQIDTQLWLLFFSDYTLALVQAIRRFLFYVNFFIFPCSYGLFKSTLLIFIPGVYFFNIGRSGMGGLEEI